MDYAAVAFVDVLGFAEMVQADSRASEPVHLRTFLEVFERIRTEYGGGLRMFSDSIVVEAGLDLAGVQRVVSVAGRLQREFLGCGVLVRGGVAFGKHFSDTNTIYSEALVSAYYIESRKARNPRIVVDLNLIDFFENHPSVTQAEKKWLDEFLCRDRDGCVFINYIDSDNVEALTPRVADLITSTDRRSDSVVEKICWLLDYHSFACGRAGREDLRVDGQGLAFSTY